MKKKLICILIVISMFSGILSACGSGKKVEPVKGENLAVNASYTHNDKTSTSFSLKSRGRSEVKIKFPSAITFNTIVLNEKTTCVDAFEFWIEKDGKLEIIYKQDEIGGTRYCYLDEITTDNLILRAYAIDGEFNINSFEVYNTKRPQKDFRTTTYLPVDQFLRDYAENPQYSDGLNHVTDIILFGCAKYDEKGELNVNEEALDKTLKIISEIRKDNKNPLNIYCDFVLKSEIKNDKNLPGQEFFASLQKIALEENKAKLIDNLVVFANEKQLSGISFDYEYPYSHDDYNVFSNFLVEMKKSAPKTKIAIAVAPWGLLYTQEAKDAVDVFEVMAYDLMDKKGDHSGWQNCCVDAINYMAGKGIDLKKVDLGIPFYSRPTDYGNKWDSWRGDVSKISRFGNFTSFEGISYEDDAGTKPFWTKGKWYNGENLVMDKTAYCYDVGVGGIMVFQYNCDVEYSNERSLMANLNSVFDDTSK